MAARSSSHPLAQLLAEAYGAVRPLLAGYDATGRIPSRQAWPCPACEQRPYRHRLTVPLFEDGEPPRCANGCPLDSIVAALARDRAVRSSHVPVVPTVSSFQCGLSALGSDKPRRAVDLAADPEAVAAALGMPSTVGPCPLPGHTGEARLEIRHGDRRLACECEQGPGWTALGDVFAAVSTGELQRRRSKRDDGPSKGERWQWTLLLAHAAGLIEPVEVQQGEMPPGARFVWHDARGRRRSVSTGDMRVMAADMALQAGLELATGIERPLLYTLRFAARRLRLAHPKQAGRVLDALVAAGVFERVGKMRVSGKRSAWLYAKRPVRPAGAGDVEAAALGRAEREGAAPLGVGVPREPGHVLAVEEVAKVDQVPLVGDAQIAAGLGEFGALVGGAEPVPRHIEAPSQARDVGHGPECRTGRGVSGRRA